MDTLTLELNDTTPATVEPMARQQLPAVASEAASLMEVISRAASDPAVDVEKLERIMALYERMDARKGEQAYHEAMSAAQADMRPVATDANNPQTKSQYASYAALDRALRPIYVRHGFSLSFNTAEGAAPDHVRVVCKVFHRAGHAELHHIDMPADGKGAKGGDVMTKTHATGAAMSYGQRYLLRGVFNIAVFDDVDGNGASAPTKITQAQLDELLALADSAEVDKAHFCGWLGNEAGMEIASFAAIPPKLYGKAKTALTGFKNRQQNGAGR